MFVGVVALIVCSGVDIGPGREPVDNTDEVKELDILSTEEVEELIESDSEYEAVILAFPATFNKTENNVFQVKWII